MRRFGVALIATAVFLGGCGDDDDGGLGEDAAQTIVDGALLDADDLGAGWQLTDTIAADDEDVESPLDDCIAADEVDLGDLALSEERRFSMATEVIVPAEVGVSAGASSDAARMARLHDTLARDSFQSCVRETFERELAGTGGAEVGEIEVDDDLADVDDVTVSRLIVPLTFVNDQFSLEATIDVVIVTTGQVGGQIFAFGPRGTIVEEDLAHWATLMGERLRG